MIIPETINALPMREAFVYYRDILNFHVYPVWGPWAEHLSRKERGKVPAKQSWPTRTPQSYNLEEFFNGNGHCYNIGWAPRKPIIALDLDSKHDKGKTVRDFIAGNQKITEGPWHDTHGGVHLVFTCPDLPDFQTKNRLTWDVMPGMGAELFFSGHSNLVLPPSLHVENFVYRWAGCGEVPEILWEWIKTTFNYKAPAVEEGKKRAWYAQFKGDLKTLDLVAMLEHLGHPAELINTDEQKFSILCPWHKEHSDEDRRGTSTVVWQTGDDWPGFRCLHAHCNERGFQALLEWAEGKELGIVDRFCESSRVWNPREKAKDNRPRVLWPGTDRLISEVHTEIGKILKPKHVWFKRSKQLVLIDKVPSGFIYSPNPDTEYAVEAYTTGFCEMAAQEARSRIEDHVTPGYLFFNAQTGDLEFKRSSFSMDFCSSLVNSDHLRREIGDILRVLTVPTPIRVGDQLVFPSEGYDSRFGTFKLSGPAIKDMSLKTALRIIEDLHADFPFTSEQSKCHAIARLLTPFARGLLGWTTRVPLWFYIANRPRAGKDYLAMITLIVYEGYGFEDLPLDKDHEETRKRIMAGARSGRHFMHFSNCQDYLNDPYFCQVITAPVIAGRALGANDGAADLVLPNEIEFSLSGNVGLTYREDFEGRMRKIELAYFQEDMNARKFSDAFLHETIKENRSDFLSAIAALYKHWAGKGFPEGTIFTSFPRWAKTVGGVMLAADIGDPCLPFRGEYDSISGDRLTEAMTELFRVCHVKFGNEPVVKKEVYSCIQESGDNDALSFFGDLEGEKSKSNKTKLGFQLLRFKERDLNGIKLVIEEVKPSDKNKYRFLKSTEPLNVSEPFISHRGRDLHQKGVGGVQSTGSSTGSSDRQKDQKGQRFSGLLALDIETYAEIRLGKHGKPLKSKDALNAQKADIRLVQMAYSNGEIVIRDLRERPLFREEREALESRELISHNVAFELRFLGTKLAIVANKVFCTMTASKLLHPGREFSHKLGDVLERHLGVKIPKDLGSSDWGGMILTEEQLEYARNDVRYLHRLKDKLEGELKEAKLERVFEMESKLILVTAAMEVHGFTIDRGAMITLKEASDDVAINLAACIRQEFGNEKLNPASPKQLLKAFAEAGIYLDSSEWRDEEGIPIQKLHLCGDSECPEHGKNMLMLKSVDEETLMRLEDPRAKTILRYRTAAKLSSNIETLLKAEHGGRIHSIFNPFGATTGRFSSKEPNLQNVTRGPLRACFVPSTSDRKLIVADYSQIELRVAALIAGDKVMIDAFKTGEDLHHKTAASALGREITRQERNQVGKATNFGFLYGQGPPGFVRYARTNYELMLSLDDAKVFHGRFFLLYPWLKQWHSKCWELAGNPANNTARTIFGRLLLPDGDRPWNRFVMLTNYRVQGSCADLIKAAMIKTTAILSPEVRLVATVHDELIFDAPWEIAEHARGVIEQAMVDAFVEMFGSTVPVEVEAKVCNHWGDK